MSEPTTVTETSLPREQVLLVPGYAFFVELLEYPEGLQSSEIANFAELNLETLAPFPIEHLIWGFVKDEASRRILLYATHRDRLKQLGFPEIDSFLWVVPDFMPVATLRFERPVSIVLRSSHGAACLEFEAQRTLPVSIRARAAFEELDAADNHPDSLFIRSEGPVLSDSGLPLFQCSLERSQVADSVDVPEQIRLSEDALWHADLRSPVFKKAERSRRRLGSIVAKATALSVYAAMLLIVLELGIFLSNSWLDSKQAKVAGQAQEVRRIEDKQSLMDKLDQVAQNELRPIAILEALNETRPSGIYFTGTVTEGRNRITVDGIATTINELNAYTESLSDSGKFKLVGSPKQITRSGRTTFTVTLDYLAAPLDGQAQEMDGGRG